MQGQTADKTVLRIRVGWVPGIVAGAGLALTVFGLTPALATSSGGTGTHQSYVCEYIGNPLKLSPNSPLLVDIAAVQAGWMNNGQYYVLIPDATRLDTPPSISECPAEFTPPTTTTTSTTTGPTVTASGSSTTSSTTSSTSSSTTSSATSTTTQPTVTASVSSTTSSTASTTTQPTVSTTSSPTTKPTVTAKPVVHSTGAPKPPAATGHRSISDPAANAVPLAATDGADLAGQPVQSPRDGILASGFLLMMAGGVLSTRRTHAK